MYLRLVNVYSSRTEFLSCTIPVYYCLSSCQFPPGFLSRHCHMVLSTLYCILYCYLSESALRLIKRKNIFVTNPNLSETIMHTSSGWNLYLRNIQILLIKFQKPNMQYFTVYVYHTSFFSLCWILAVYGIKTLRSDYQDCNICTLIY